MFAARVTARLQAVLCTSATRSLRSVNPKSTGLARVNFAVRCQQYASQTRQGTKRTAKTRTLKKIAQSQVTGSGRGLLVGVSVVGIGTICYYGLRLSHEVGSIEGAGIWPEYVRDRVRSTYMYFGMGIAATTASAVAINRYPALLMRIASKSRRAAFGCMAVIMTSGVSTMLLPYSEGMGLKQLAWLGHSGLLGVVLAPICFTGGPILIRAACYAVGAVGGLSCIAMCAPGDKFLYMGGAVAMGLGAVFAASVAPATALGSGLYAVNLYGGLVAFGGFMLYDTHMIAERAERHPINAELHQMDAERRPTVAEKPFDPINNAMRIYLDTTIFSFIYIAAFLASGGRGREEGGRGRGRSRGAGGGGGGKEGGDKIVSDEKTRTRWRYRSRKPLRRTRTKRSRVEKK